MTSYHTAIDIEALPDRVWLALTVAMPKQPKPFGILKLEGTLQKGARLKLWSEVSPDRTFALNVETFDPPNAMVWRGGMPFGLFTGTRRFLITQTATGSRFEMTEQFSGPLAGLITKTIPDLTPSFVKFAQTLKKEAETA